MKTRTDFVSNSSSCSFIISTNNGFKLDEFIKELCKGCIKHTDEDNSWQSINEQYELNAAILNYHLRTSELLYLGNLDIGPVQITWKKEDNDVYFLKLKEQIRKGSISKDERVIENLDDRIVIEYNDYINGMAISTFKIDFITYEFHWSNDYSVDIEKQKKVAESIYKFSKNYSDSNTDYKCRIDNNIYFISRKTIWNTRALIAAGYNLKLEDWMDLDKFEDMLLNGKKIFGIRINNGGDGVDADSIYSYGGWDGEDAINDVHNISIIHSENM